MGCGASTGLAAAISAATEDELKAALKDLPADAEAKLTSALEAKPAEQISSGLTMHEQGKRSLAEITRETIADAEREPVKLTLETAAEALGYDPMAATRLAVALDGNGETPPHFGVEALLDSVLSGAIAALKGSYVIELYESGGRLKRRQDLPPEAFWRPAELCDLIKKLKVIGADVYEDEDRLWPHLFVALSYRWLDKGHPDKDAFHLAIVAEVAKIYIRAGPVPSMPRTDWSKKLIGAYFSPLGQAFDEADVGGAKLGMPDFALFWDYCSLYQEPRRPAEDTLFLPGLRSSNIWYGHQGTTCWMQTELPVGFAEKMRAMKPPLADTYDQSGWCFVEAMISAVLKPGARRLDLALRSNVEEMEPRYGGGYAYTWGYDEEHDLSQQCMAGRKAPLLPNKMRDFLEKEKKFTCGKKDVEMVDQLYRNFFYGATRFTTKLDFMLVTLGDEEGEQLANVLSSFSGLAQLNLRYTKLGTKACAALAEYLKGSTSLTFLNMSNNFIKDEGAIVLADGLKKNTSLKQLKLYMCGIDSEGGMALAKAFKVNTTLERVFFGGDRGRTYRDSRGNDMGDEAEQALREAWGSVQGREAARLQIGEPEYY